MRNTETETQQKEQISLARAGGVNLTKEEASKLRLEHKIRIHYLAIVVLTRAF